MRSCEQRVFFALLKPREWSAIRCTTVLGFIFKMWTVMKIISYDCNNFTSNMRMTLNRPSCKWFSPFFEFSCFWPHTHLDGCHDEKDSIWHGLFSQNCFHPNIYVVIERKGLTEGFVLEYWPVADRNVTSVIPVQCYTGRFLTLQKYGPKEQLFFFRCRLHILAHIQLHILICFCLHYCVCGSWSLWACLCWISHWGPHRSISGRPSAVLHQEYTEVIEVKKH